MREETGRRSEDKNEGLAFWLQFARDQQEPYKTEATAVVVYGDQVSRTPFDLKQPTITGGPSKTAVLKSDSIVVQLKFLWADVKFWRLVHDGADAQLLHWHIRSAHNLNLPEIPGPVWKRMAKKSKVRDEFFNLFATQEWRWVAAPVTLETERVRLELKKKWFRTLIEEYLTHTEVGMTYVMASQEFTSEALKTIKMVGARLKEDADWCLKNPGQIPAPCVRQKQGHPKTLEVIERIERFAAYLRKDQNVTPHAMALRHRVKDPTHKAADDLETLRNAAEAAAILLFYREGIRVNTKSRLVRKG